MSLSAGSDEALRLNEGSREAASRISVLSATVLLDAAEKIRAAS